MRTKMNKKKAKPRQNNKSMPKELKNEADRMIANGLTEGLLGFNPFTEGVQLSQVDTLFKNNRWYLVSNMRQLLSEMYVEYGIIQTIIDVPVNDGLRGGIKIKTSQLSEEDVNALEAEMAYQGDLQEAGQALKWNRLFGGAGIIIVTDQPANTELDINSLHNNPLAFRAADMWELYYSQMNLDDDSMDENLRFKRDMENYNYYGQVVHRSRVMKLKGLKPPSFVRPRLRGWGFSVVESIIRSVNQYLKATNLSFEVLDEFKLDIYRMKDLLNTLLSPDGTSKVQNRVSLANKQKNYQNAIVLDSEDEYQQKQLSFSGLAETMSGIRLQLASDLRMPMTKLFGMSASGFNSGEDDIENYNAMVEGTVREPARYHILRMIELRCQQMFGVIPDDLEMEFHSLRILSSEQEETVKTQKFNRLLQARQAGEITSMEFRMGCNSDDLLPHKLSDDDLDTSYDGPEVTSEPLPVNPKNKAQNELEHDGDGLN
jgi:phage-related protein (TIGR01555 family)